MKKSDLPPLPSLQQLLPNSRKMWCLILCCSEIPEWPDHQEEVGKDTKVEEADYEGRDREDDERGDKVDSVEAESYTSQDYPRHEKPRSALSIEL